MNQKDIETLAIALPEDILKAKWCGDFDRAFHLIDLYLANEKVPAFMKTRLALEREVLKALPTGYTYSEEDALALVQKEIPDFTKAELDALRDRGAIDWIYINGKNDVFPHVLRYAFGRLPGYRHACRQAAEGQK